MENRLKTYHELVTKINHKYNTESITWDERGKLFDSAEMKKASNLAYHSGLTQEERKYALTFMGETIHGVIKNDGKSDDFIVISPQIDYEKRRIFAYYVIEFRAACEEMEVSRRIFPKFLDVFASDDNYSWKLGEPHMDFY